MGYPHVALIGAARSGKDTVAARLVSRFAYTRLAFADPLKDAALAFDPIVGAEPGVRGFLPVRLSDAIQRKGWERAKDEMPEVRRTLQKMGEGIREFDPDFWLRLLLDKVDAADKWNMPVVVSDVRYPNEADALKAKGFRMVRIIRPTYPADTVTSEELKNRRHVSETALNGYVSDSIVTNAGTLAALHERVDALVD
jgi:hypothetical protein